MLHSLYHSSYLNEARQFKFIITMQLNIIDYTYFYYFKSLSIHNYKKYFVIFKTIMDINMLCQEIFKTILAKENNKYSFDMLLL